MSFSVGCPAAVTVVIPPPADVHAIWVGAGDVWLCVIMQGSELHLCKIMCSGLHLPSGGPAPGPSAWVLTPNKGWLLGEGRVPLGWSCLGCSAVWCRQSPGFHFLVCEVGTVPVLAQATSQGG